MSDADNFNGGIDNDELPDLSWSKHQIFMRAHDLAEFNRLRARAISVPQSQSQPQPNFWSRIQTQLYTYKSTKGWEHAETYRRLRNNHIHQTPITSPKQRAKRDRSTDKVTDANHHTGSAQPTAVPAVTISIDVTRILTELTAIRQEQVRLVELVRAQNVAAAYRDADENCAVAVDDDYNIIRSPPQTPTLSQQGSVSVPVSVPVNASHVVLELFGYSYIVL